MTAALKSTPPRTARDELAQNGNPPAGGWFVRT